MLAPNKVKHRKWQKSAGNSKPGQIATSKTKVNFGQYGLKGLGNVWLTGRQIESARRVITRSIHKKGKLWIRVFPDKPITKKGAEVPMGSGKGAVDHFVCPVRIGTIIFELGGVDEKIAKRALILAAYKLPMKCRFVYR